MLWINYNLISRTHDINLLLSERNYISISYIPFISISIFNLQFPFFLYLFCNFEYLCLLLLFLGGGVRMFCASVIDHCTRPSLPDRIKALVPQVSHLHRSSTHTHKHTHSLTYTHTYIRTLSLSLSLSLFYSLTHSLWHTLPLSIAHTHIHTLSLSRTCTLSLSLSLSHPFFHTLSLSIAQTFHILIPVECVPCCSLFPPSGGDIDAGTF